MILVATGLNVVRCDIERGTMTIASGLDGVRPTCLVADPRVAGRVWCGTHRDGVFRSDDAGATWQPVGLRDARIMSVAASPAEDVVWIGTEPSEVWRSDDEGATWQPTSDLTELPSSSEWSFPPKPDTHHVRWIACHPHQASRLWIAIEAGALVSTQDGGATWHDRVPGGPWDTHELAIHPQAPDTLRVAAGDGYLESHDAGATWSRPMEGLDVGYLRSIAIDPGDASVVIVSASSHAHSAYMVGRSDGRLYRREGEGAWTRVVDGWPDPPVTIAPLLIPGAEAGELIAADERGVHWTGDGGVGWEEVVGFEKVPSNLRGVAMVGS